MIGAKVVVLYSGEAENESWFSECSDIDKSRVAYFHLGYDQVRYFADVLCDFLFEFKPNEPPPWEALKGRSAKCKALEQEFANKLKNQGA